MLQGNFSRDNIEQWLINELAARLRLRVEDLSMKEPFSQYGLDSAEAVILAGDLSKLLNQELEPTIFWNYPTIEQLSDFIWGSFGRGEKELGTVKSMARTEVEEHETDGIAIIGIGCRFPGAKNKNEFWKLLEQGVDAISQVPSERWNIDEYYDPEPKARKMRTRWGGFLEDIDQFDAQFFGISPREAEQMDPQQRVLLEVCWEALEDAGLPMEKISGTQTGAFIGISTNDYGRKALKDSHGDYDIYPMTGNSFSIAANRISYVFNLRGPSIAIDTACSSSLTAVHLACKSIQAKESKLAIAGGVNLILSPEITVGFSKAGMMAADGRCKTFDHRADGYVRGEGAGIVVLKSFKKAQEDGDLIYAVIKGSAINQDGKSNGITAPNGQSQEAVLLAAYQKAKVHPSQVKYVEAHGTGTPLGDPIEISALYNVLCAGRDQANKLRVGSVKTNIGHVESAAGIAGLIKVALSTAHRKLPKSLHFESANPAIPFEKYNISVQQELRTIDSEEGVFIAGVSSFGFGGTNVHVVVQAPPRIEQLEEHIAEQGSLIFPFSAQTKKQLWELIESYRKSVHNFKNIGNLSYSLSTRRSHFKHRHMIVANSLESLEKQLAAYTNTDRQAISSKSKGVVFVYPILDKQALLLAAELFKECKPFRDVLGHCDEIIRKRSGWYLLDHIFREDSSCFTASKTKSEAMLAIQLALTVQWKAWGIVSEKVVAFHSRGVIKKTAVEEKLNLETLFSQLDSGSFNENEQELAEYARQELDSFLQEGYDSFLMLGQNQEVMQLIKQSMALSEQDGHVLGEFEVGTNLREQYLEHISTLYARGAELNWPNIFETGYKPIRLLPYPWQRESYWFENSSKFKEDRGLKGKEIKVAGIRNQRVWEVTLDTHTFTWLNDHIVLGSLVLPGAVYIEMLHETITALYGPQKQYSIQELHFKEALFLEKEPTKIQVCLETINDYVNHVSIYSERQGGRKIDEQWCLHTIGEISFEHDRY